MPRLEINTPFETDQPRITVEVDANAPLARGRHNYQLEVVDDSGNVSAPDRVVVIVVTTSANRCCGSRTGSPSARTASRWSSPTTVASRASPTSSSSPSRGW